MNYNQKQLVQEFAVEARLFSEKYKKLKLENEPLFTEMLVDISQKSFIEGVSFAIRKFGELNQKAIKDQE